MYNAALMPRACNALHSAQLEIANATLAACDELRIGGVPKGRIR
jgi:hypothetical protein